MSELETAFSQAMRNTYQEAVKVGYKPARFLQMLNESGGIETARIILAQPNTTDGFATLWEKNRLDLSVEALVLKPEFRSLFTDEERTKARTRLADANYAAPWDQAPADTSSEAEQEAASRADRFVWQPGDITITHPAGSVAAADTAPPTPSMVDRLSRAVAATEGGATSSSAADTPPIQWSREALQPLIQRFIERYESFDSQFYLDDERTYKRKAAVQMDGLINEKTLRNYIDQGQFEEAKTAIIKACRGSFLIGNTRQQNNLLNQWDMRVLLDTPAEPLAQRLYALLYGQGSFTPRFNAWVDLLAQQKPGVWPAATYFRMLQDPDYHIFVKPTPFQFFLKRVAGEQRWPTRPDATSYKQFQELGRQLLVELNPLGARDLIDVQSFIWSVYYYAERAAWIFQANPKNYDLPGALAELDEIDWGVRQHEKDIKIGDTVYMWEAGDNAGVLAVARVLTEPAQMDEDERELRFYRDTERFNGADRRVRLQIEQVLPQRLSRSALASDPQLSSMAILKNAQGTNFKLTAEEAGHLAGLIEDLSSAAQWPPDSLDGPAFVIVNSGTRTSRIEGTTYIFSSYTIGDRPRLRAALEAFQQTGKPVYVIVYRSQPYYTFTAWARVVGVIQDRGGEGDETRWLVDLDLHEFPVPLNLKGHAAAAVMNQVSWLADGLLVGFRGYSIRQITTSDFQIIIDAARGAGGGLMTLADAAFTILSRVGGGPLHLKEILSQAQAAGLVETAGQTPQLSLSSALLRDERFRNLGGNTWVLAEPSPDTELTDETDTLSDVVVSEGTNFWRIHFPREWWDDARRNNTIGIGFADSPTNQSVQRLRRINVGDRIVAYVQGGVIGGIGVVTQPYRDDAPAPATAANLFGGGYQRRIGVAWSDAPAEPVPILDQLKQPTYTTLYNRLKNPHTVIPLSSEDYQHILALTGGVDPATAATETRLPAIRDTLGDYLALARSLGDAPLSVDDLITKARELFIDLKPLVDEETLVADLRQLRLLQSAAEGYRRATYVQGDDTAIMRIMALALLIPIEGSDAVYELPARTIVPRLMAMAGSQTIDSFAPELGADRLRMLEWYHEAGFVAIDESQDLWQLTPDALLPRSGDDPAAQTYNEFLGTLLDIVRGTHKSDLAPATGPLPPVPALDARLRELGQQLLIDDMIVRRIYRSLMAGRHVILSGPPGTGKTELAKLLPSLLWYEQPQTFTRLTTDLDQAPVLTTKEERHGYAAIVVTATEDWGVRDVVGGIGPQLDGEKGLGYTIQHGVLTRVLLQHYDGTDSGRRLPTQPHAPTRRDYRHEDGKRYRGAWLVIDEFTRAPVDAAFGSLLTTLGGGEHASLAVPAASGEAREVPLPRDFRIIGTLNSFDRHFLNQISEAMKRRFDFIDVPPPSPGLEAYEQGIAAAQALDRLQANGFDAIAVAGSPPSYRWEHGSGAVVATSIETAEGMRRYELQATNADASATLLSFWQLFRAIRVFRQLGTAQVIAVYTNLFAGVLASGMRWSDALDTALADSLADQLQVLTRDEQRVIDAYVEHAGLEGGAAFERAFRAILKSLPPGRQPLLLHALRAADDVRQGSGDIPMEEKTLTTNQITRIFQPEQPFNLPRTGIFRKRLRDLIGERGL